MEIWHTIEDGFPTKSGWYLIRATYGGGEVYETTDYYDADKCEWDCTGRVANRVLEWTERDGEE